MARIKNKTKPPDKSPDVSSDSDNDRDFPMSSDCDDDPEYKVSGSDTESEDGSETSEGSTESEVCESRVDENVGRRKPENGKYNCL
jgi:hypothetical protein